jgi:F-type H+-transporting ATPase subunit gamma
MSQLKDIKDRIESVKQTCKITQAMKMVAAAKFKKASSLAVKSRQYADQLEFLLATLVAQSDTNGIPLLSTTKSTNQSTNTATKEAVIIVSGDRGLCGGFNANITKAVNVYLSENTGEVDFFFWGIKAYESLKRKLDSIKDHASGLNNKTSVDEITQLATPITAAYINGTYSSIKVIYTEFKSAISSDTVVRQIVPIEIDAAETKMIDYFIEPSPEQVLQLLSEDYVNLILYRSIIESFASEQGARMTAMDSATDNAKEVINDLKLQYNRGRQAQITTELSEIVAGSEALVQ